MPPETVNINTKLVRQLIAHQFPHRANLPVTEVKPNGWDNRTFRLGEQLSVQLPSAERYAPQARKEHYWLPKLALKLPLPIPTPVAIGKPSLGYLWQWSIYRWIDGETARDENIDDLTQFATSLARFLSALQEIDPVNGPTPGRHNFHRGGDLAVYDDQTRQAISRLVNELDGDAVAEVWAAAPKTPWNNTPVWVHGDVSQGNLLVNDGQLSAVIDFGGTCVGDPACDLAITWAMFKGENRETFRSAPPLDTANLGAKPRLGPLESTDRRLRHH